jgi:hypothetical protein
MVADARTAAVAGGREVVFTGASLGGALVQVGGYEAAEAILAAAPGYAGRVTVFGVDSLGGRDATESLNGGRLDPAVLERMNALHIRTEGDVVSRVGSHLGDTISFQAVDAAGNPVLLSAREAHVNIPSLLATLSSDALFAAGARRARGDRRAGAAVQRRRLGACRRLRRPGPRRRLRRTRAVALAGHRSLRPHRPVLRRRRRQGRRRRPSHAPGRRGSGRGRPAGDRLTVRSGWTGGGRARHGGGPGA